jgi:asparagine synthase (glutamine-hydrolysing)
MVKETRTEDEMLANVRSLLLESVRIRLRADVPVGIYLSGGIDSSALAGMAAHLVKEEGLAMGSHQVGKGQGQGELGQEGEEDSRICCFSIAFDEGSGYDESGESIASKSD